MPWATGVAAGGYHCLLRWVLPALLCSVHKWRAIAKASSPTQTVYRAESSSLPTVVAITVLTDNHKHVSSEGLRAPDVDERGAGAAVPGGGRRRVRAGARRLPRRPAERPPPRSAKSIWEDPCVPRWRSRPVRVTRDRQIHPPKTQDRRPRPTQGKQQQHRGGSNGRRVDGSGSPAVLPGHLARRVRVHHLPRHARHHGEPGDRRREPGEAQESARGLRGSPGEEQVPGRRLHQLRRPQPLPVHVLLHGHSLCVCLRRVPEGEGVVGGAEGQAGGEEGLREYAYGLLVPSHQPIYAALVCVGSTME